MADKGKGSQDTIGTTGKLSIAEPKTERGSGDTIKTGGSSLGTDK